MKITSYIEINKGNLLAIFDLEIIPGVTIKGFRVLEGKNGPWVATPSEKLAKPYQKKDGSMQEYYEPLWVEKDQRATIQSLGLNYSNKSGDEIPF